MKQFLKNINPFHNGTDMPLVQLIIKKILAFCLCYIGGTIIATIAMILIHFLLGKNMLAGEQLELETMTLIKYYGFGLFALVMILYWKKVEKKSLGELGLTRNFGSYFVGVALAVVMVAVTVWGSILSGSMEYCGVYESINVWIMVLFVGSFAIQGAMEEIFCRGFLLHGLKKQTGTAVAVVLSTIMFVLPHCSSLFAEDTIYGIIGIINLILISAAFTLLTLQYENLWAACGLHSCWNALVYCVLGLGLSGNDGAVTAIFDIRLVKHNIFNGSVYGIEASVVILAVLAVSVSIMWVLYQKAAKKRENNDQSTI